MRVASAVVPWEHLEKKILRGNLSCGKVSLRLENKETFHPTYLSKMLCIWFASVPVPSSWHLVLRAFPHVEWAVRWHRKTAKVFKRLKKTFLKGFNKNIGWAVVMGCRLVQPHPLISEGLHLAGSSLYPSMSYFLPPPLVLPWPTKRSLSSVPQAHLKYPQLSYSSCFLLFITYKFLSKAVPDNPWWSHQLMAEDFCPFPVPLSLSCARGLCPLHVLFL